MPVDRPSRTAKVEVDSASAQFDGQLGAGCQPRRIAPQQLHLHRQTSRAAAPESQLRNMRQDGPRWRHRLTDPQVLGDAEGKAAELGQEGAHRRIGHPFHGGKNEGRGAQMQLDHLL